MAAFCPSVSPDQEFVCVLREGHDGPHKSGSTIFSVGDGLMAAKTPRPLPTSGTFHPPIHIGPGGVEALRRAWASLESFAAAMRPLADALRRMPAPRWRIYSREVNRPPSHAAENAKFGARQRRRRRR